MATLTFTDEMMEELAANPYVIKVTRHNIYFSGEFKQMFFQKMCEGEPDEDFSEALE